MIRPNEADKYYRYVDYRESDYFRFFDDYQDHPGTSHVCVRCDEFKVVRRTKKGVWIMLGYGFAHQGLRFILSGTRKKFAAPTKKEAMESFVARKKAQLRIYEARANQARESLKLASELIDPHT